MQDNNATYLHNILQRFRWDHHPHRPQALALGPSSSQKIFNTQTHPVIREGCLGPWWFLGGPRNSALHQVRFFPYYRGLWDAATSRLKRHLVKWTVVKEYISVNYYDSKTWTKGFSIACGAPPLQLAQKGTRLIRDAMTSTIPFW